MDPFSKFFSDLILCINSDFYENIYNDEWLREVFRNIEKNTIITQQTDFMIQAFGGPSLYCGRMPGDAHPHIYIDEYIWQLREKYLIMAFEKNNTPKDISEKWLKIDNSFKNKIIKKSLSDLTPRFTTDELIIVLKK